MKISDSINAFDVLRRVLAIALVVASALAPVDCPAQDGLPDALKKELEKANEQGKKKDEGKDVQPVKYRQATSEEIEELFTQFKSGNVVQVRSAAKKLLEIDPKLLVGRIDELIRFMGPDNYDQCITAVTIAGRIGSDARKTVPYLLGLMEFWDAAFKDKVLAAIRSVGYDSFGPDDTAQIPRFVAAMKVPDPRVTEVASNVLKKIGKASVQPLLDELRNPMHPNRQAVIDTIMSFEGAAAAMKPVFEEMLKNPAENPAMRQLAAEELGKLGNENADFLIAVAENEANPAIQSMILDTIKKMRIGDKVLPLLEKLAGSSDRSLRKNAIETLGAVEPTPGVLEIMRGFLKNPDDEIRIAALNAIVRMGPPAKEFAAEIRKLASEANSSIAELAMTACVAIDPGSALPLLRDMLGASLPRKRVVALEACKKLTDIEPLMPLVRKAVLDNDASVATKALDLLAHLGPKIAMPILLESIDKLNYSVKPIALKTITGFGAEAAEALPVLAKLLDDKNLNIAVTAIQAIAGMAEQANVILPQLVGAMSSNHDQIHTLAQEIILKHKDQAFPRIVEGLSGKNAHFRLVTLLGEFEPNEAVIEALVKALKHKDTNIRLYTAITLGNFGPPARKALTALRGAVKDKDVGVQLEAQSAIVKINR